MKIAIVVALVLVFAFFYVNRERLYIRDPIARVYRNSVKQSDVQVFVNASNDVLLEQDHGDRATTRILVQNWDRMPGSPARLSCVRWMVCMTSADQAPIVPMQWTGSGTYDPNVLMSSREVSFVNGDGAQMIIELN
jgi:hypothetical protein